MSGCAPTTKSPQQIGGCTRDFAQLTELFRTLFIFINFCTNCIKLTHDMMSLLSAAVLLDRFV